MGRRRIAVLLAQADENAQDLFMKGFSKEAHAMNFDVCVFSMFMKCQDNAFREMGDSNIYNLINYDAFDAVVVLSDTIQTAGVADEIEETIHNVFDGPVLFVDKDSRYFPTVKINHYKPFRKLIDHLIEEHNYKDIVFLNGWKEHIHSIQRENAYRDSMSAHGLTVSEDNIYYGNYWYDTGKKTVREILNKRDTLPDAIACANDCMAIGAAAELFSNHIQVPEQVAVIGYDSTNEGKNIKKPLTSADIPFKECGTYCVKYIKAKLDGNEDIPEFESESPLFIGESCGCHPKYHQEEETFHESRNIWNTDLASAGYNAYYNSLVEDLLSETDHRSFFNTVFQHVYQIRPFSSFSICMNDYWKSSEIMTGDEALKKGYTETVYRVLKCGPKEEIGNIIDFNDVFESEKMIPELYEDREKPETFYFTPLHFNDRSFGYSVISFSDSYAAYSNTYRNWCKSIMQSMEAFYRQNGLKTLLAEIEATQVRDAMTGLYNYKGFLEAGNEFCENATFNEKTVMVAAVDISKLKNINSRYGRKSGDTAIIRLAQFITECSDENALCARIGNDEFIVAEAVENASDTDGHVFLDKLHEKLNTFNKSGKEPYDIEIYAGTSSDMIVGSEALDQLVNDTVAIKNNKKALEQSKAKNSGVLTDKEKENDELVTYILDNNKFIYHFQPIISAKTGEVYAYEALMRADTERKISPLELLASAERLGRLYDVEKATFFNVVNFVDCNYKEFEGKKIFINSIPGSQLDGKDKEELEEILAKHAGKIVVEFTEETEMEDEQFEKIKEKYSLLNIETAIDDYGSGYSNVNNLLKYMPKFVKIDRALMTDIHESPQKQHFVKDVIEFAHDNDIMALAEGIELTQELKEVIRLGVDLIQGYYTSKPHPYVVRSIDERVINEIVQYNQNPSTKYYRKRYEVRGDETVSLVQMALNKYTGVIIKQLSNSSEPVVLKGTPGFQSELRVLIDDNVDATIIIKNVSLAGERGLPCIDIGENCNIHLKLDGDNELRTGGIKVPASSSLTIVGEGNLNITLNAGKYYGIGNAVDAKNGVINFEQDGEIIIKANGMKGIGIGSGQGGVVNIRRGQYDLELKGQDGVCIGSIDGEANMNIEYCDINIYSGISKGTIIGSVHNNAYIDIENVSANIQGSGNVMSGIGTLEGDACKVRLENVNISSNIRAKECYGIGCRNGETDINISHAAVKSIVQGKAAVAIGNAKKTAKIYCSNADVNTNAVTDFGSDMGASENDIRLENGRAEFILNGEEITRDILSSEL